MDFFWELCTLILIMLLGHWIEMKSVAGASRELELLVEMMPATAHMVHGDHVMDVNTLSSNQAISFLSSLERRLQHDGMISEGESYFNRIYADRRVHPGAKTKRKKVIAGLNKRKWICQSNSESWCC
jgi:Cu2+-exporting ATPase